MMKNAGSVHGTIEKALQWIEVISQGICNLKNAANLHCVSHEHKSQNFYFHIKEIITQEIH